VHVVALVIVAWLAPVGPLSTTVRSAETPWSERTEAMRLNEARRINAREIREDLAAFERVLDLWFEPRSEEQRAGQKNRREHVRLLERVGYGVSSTTRTLIHIGDKIPFCARTPGELSSCDVDFQGVTPRDPTKPTYEVTFDGDVVTLVVRDLSGAAWTTFADDLPVLARARALRVDLRGAAGSDPRPILPFLASVTGRSMVGVIREVRRPAALATHVEAYRARFADTTRDAGVWQALVGTRMKSIGGAKRAPVVVIVDRDCQSACELAARVLATFNDATVIGAVGKTGRIARDEAAVMVLPHSQIEIYFHATEYRLAAEIEAKTGSTDDWWKHQIDTGGLDVTYSLRELRARMVNPSWPPRCDSFASKLRRELPADARAKLNGESDLAHCHRRGTLMIKIEANVPYEVLRRFLATCPGSVAVGVDFRNTYSLHTNAGFSSLSRLVQSELVDRIDVECRRSPRGF
jgi:hypothetical protein